MRLLTQYGRLAERHWLQFCPKLVAALQVEGRLQAMLLQASEKTTKCTDARASSVLKSMGSQHA